MVCVVQNGYSPLIIAAQNGHKDTAELLLNCKADVNQAIQVDDAPCVMYHPAMASTHTAHTVYVSVVCEIGV